MMPLDHVTARAWVASLLAFVTLGYSMQLWAADPSIIDPGTGTEIALARFESQSQTGKLLIWLPSPRGLGYGYREVAPRLAANGIEVWALDLHDTYMISPGRRSIDQFSRDDLLALVQYANANGFDQVYWLGAARSAALALEVGRRWQSLNRVESRRMGFVLISPHLIEEGFAMGEAAEYTQIARSTNLPVLLLQPEYSTKYARTEEIASALRSGGAPVYVQKLPGVAGGFYGRKDENLAPVDRAARDRLASSISRAAAVMASAELPHEPAPMAEAVRDEPRTKRSLSLHPFRGEAEPPPLSLPQMGGGSQSLAALLGEVVLVNFWATWCGPCLREIPSMTQLVKRMRGRGFHVLAVNIGENEERIDAWTRGMGINFPVLLDLESSTVRDWRVYAYPSNFLIDRQGRIRYSFRGALDWQDPQVMATIDALM